jgi:hypothetical protein
MNKISKFSKHLKDTYYHLQIVALIKMATSNFINYKNRFITGSYDRTCKIW